MTNTLTPQQAEEIIAKYGNKAGRRPADYYQAIEILGIEKTTSKSAPAKKNYNNTTGNKIYKNEGISDNEKFRYIRMKEIAEINTTQISADAHHLLLVLMTSPSSNALGAFQISINEMCMQTGGRSKEAITTALNELIELKKVRYINNCIYVTDFHSNQKSHGNADNLKSVFKLYNALNDDQKLPYIGSIEYQNMNMDELTSEFNKLIEAIQFMSIIDASDTTIDVSKYKVYTPQQIEAIYTKNKRHYGATNEQNTLASFTPPEPIAETSEIEIESNNDDDLQPQLDGLVELVVDVKETEPATNEISNHDLIYSIQDATELPIDILYNTPLGGEFIAKVRSNDNGVEAGLNVLKVNKTRMESEEISVEFELNHGINIKTINEEYKAFFILNGIDEVMSKMKQN